MSRLQLALNVENLEASIDFFSRLFGAEPHKVRPGYANFALTDPPLKLVLMESGAEPGTINHLGVEMQDVEAVQEAARALGEKGLATTAEEDTVCCYARQDKFWVEGAPDALRFEVYTVTDDMLNGGEESTMCCTPESVAVSLGD